MQAPACVASAISVGASHDGGNQVLNIGCGTGVLPVDTATCYTNASATTDIFAPGSEITTTLNNGGIGLWHGTSFAAPLVSACVAALLETDPSLTPDDIDALLTTTTSATVTAGANVFPRLACTLAVNAALVAAGAFRIDVDL